MLAEADFFVAIDGNDANPGTKSEPFSSLVKARDAVRGLRKKQHDRDVVVLIREGIYRISKTVVFGLEDSTTEGHTTTYAAYPGETPVFSSGVPVTGWRRLDTAPEGLPAAAMGKVWVADIPEGLERFFSLYEGEKRLPRARSKGFEPTRKFDNWRGDSPRDLWEIQFPAGMLRNWPDLKDAELLIIPTADWTMNILPLKAVYEESLVARVAVPATYGLGAQKKGEHWKETAWIENVIDFLDTPGEWIVSTRLGKIIYWPVGDKPGDNIVAPGLQEYIRVQGSIDHDGPMDVPVRGLIFRGLTFMHGRRDLWDKGHLGLGLQYDWEMYDRDNAILRFRGAESCAVEACRFIAISGTAVRCDLYCQKLRIADNEIAHVGGTGILLNGYGPGTKDVNKHNEIVNNYIHHTGELYWHGLGVYIWQSGENRVANNLIHHTPYTGLVVSGGLETYFSTVESARTIRKHEMEAIQGRVGSGKPDKVEHAASLSKAEVESNDWHIRAQVLHARNNVIELNELHHTMLRLGDGNGIYLCGTGTGNVIRRNYIHHILSRYSNAAIRTDAPQRGTTITENIIYKCRAGVILKDINYAENNIIACLEHENPGAWDYGCYMSVRGGPNKGARIRRNIYYHTGGKPNFVVISRMHWLPSLELRQMDADHNLFFWAENPEWGMTLIESLRKEYGHEQHSVAADPMFMDVSKGDFRLKDDSPALKLGFRPIDQSVIGLLPFPRTRRPENGVHEQDH